MEVKTTLSKSKDQSDNCTNSLNNKNTEDYNTLIITKSKMYVKHKSINELHCNYIHYSTVIAKQNLNLSHCN